MSPIDPSFSLAYPEVATRIGVAMAAGLLVGLEREWAQKEMGVRTFAIISLVGALASLLSSAVIIAGLIGVFLLIAFLNIQALMRDKSLELTTSASLIAVLVIGSLAGLGHYFTAATSSILMTMLLAWKAELSRFADALKPDELRSAVLLGLLTVVIYPLLPNRFLDPWELFNPRTAWITVVVIAGIGFTNYVLLRLYSTRGMYYAAVLGGLVNSTASVVELSGLFGRQPGKANGKAVALILLTNISMFLRNLVLLAIFAPIAVPAALPAIAVMILITALLAWIPRHADEPPPQEFALRSPVSPRRVLMFGLVFVALSAAGTLAQRIFGSMGFLFVSALGGLVSSASTTASAAALVVAGKISPSTGALAVILASIASAAINLPLVYQQTASKPFLRRLSFATALVAVSGILSATLTLLIHDGRLTIITWPLRWP